MCLYVLIKSTLNFRKGAADGSRKCCGIRACIARMSVDGVGLDRCNICLTIIEIIIANSGTNV